jgi:hypothetical protein
MRTERVFPLPVGAQHDAPYVPAILQTMILCVEVFDLRSSVGASHDLPVLRCHAGGHRGWPKHLVGWTVIFSPLVGENKSDYHLPNIALGCTGNVAAGEKTWGLQRRV